MRSEVGSEEVGSGTQDREAAAFAQEHGPMNRRGFTLVEISIVLVIIGLIVGGILVGKELISAAGLRKDMSTVESFGAAVNTFKLKFNALPGDMINPTQFGFQAISYGNGNGRIQGIVPSYSVLYTTTPSAGGRPEWFYVQHHLGQAGLMKPDGSYTIVDNLSPQLAGVHYPAMVTSTGEGNTHDSSGGYQPGIILSYEQNNRISGHYFRMGAAPYAPAPQFLAFLAGFTAQKAFLVDNKFDDGSPISGAMQIGPLNSQCADDIYDTSNAACAQGGISTAATWYHCALTATGHYDITYGNRSCSLRVRAPF